MGCNTLTGFMLAVFQTRNGEPDHQAIGEVVYLRSRGDALYVVRMLDVLLPQSDKGVTTSDDEWYGPDELEAMELALGRLLVRVASQATSWREFSGYQVEADGSMGPEVWLAATRDVVRDFVSGALAVVSAAQTSRRYVCWAGGQ
ncbi:MAG: hypothetical protein AAF184_16915 [Pseudomonadota bacterium]